MTITFALGKNYQFTLASGKVVKVCILGENNNGSLIISINGDLPKDYKDLNSALGEPYSNVEQV